MACWVKGGMNDDLVDVEMSKLKLICVNKSMMLFLNVYTKTKPKKNQIQISNF